MNKKELIKKIQDLEGLDNEEKSELIELLDTNYLQPRAISYNNDSIKAFPSFLDGRNFNATNEDRHDKLKEIFKTDRPIDYSKPVNYIKKIIESSTYEKMNSLILDFMAGSGTTLHATMQLNEEDGGSRQCILVTNNENKIAEEVCYERNKRVIEGYTTPKGKQVPGLKNNNFRYYKTDFVGIQRTENNRRKLTEMAADMLCIKEDCYEPITNEKLPTTNEIRLFRNENYYMMLILDEDMIDVAVEIIKELDKNVKVYVFSPGQYPFTDDFVEVIEKVELCALPEAIYKAYKKILPKKK